jgi:hypothetical protein
MDSYHPSAYGHGCVAAAMAEVIEDVARRPPSSFVVDSAKPLNKKVLRRA